MTQQAKSVSIPERAREIARKMLCANQECRRPIAEDETVFVEPKDFRRVMDGKPTPQRIFCFDCKPAGYRVGTYYTSAKDARDGGK